MAFKMKGFPEIGDPKKEALDNQDELEDRKSAILERANREGRDLSKSEKEAVKRLDAMLAPLYE